MPGGVPVATVALNGALNAGIIAAQIVALSEAEVAKKLGNYKQSLREKVEKDAAQLEQLGVEQFLNSKG